MLTPATTTQSTRRSELAWSNSSIKWELDSLLHSLSCLCWDIISAMASGTAAPAEPGASQPRIESETQKWDASTSPHKRPRLNVVGEARTLSPSPFVRQRKGYLVQNAGDEEDVKNYGRLASSNREAVRGNFADLRRRRSILEETLHMLGTPNKRRRYHDLGERNSQRWKEQSTEAAIHLLVSKVQL